MIIVEYVFQTNGIGRIYFGSVAMRDYTRVLACAVLLAILIMP
jgi:ABC-type dipeptide/oligopeptide/nickel transport system permease component